MTTDAHPDATPDRPGAPMRTAKDGLHGAGDGHEHADVQGGWLRPAVFGAMDGLVSNASLVAGVAGGSAATASGTNPVVLAGLAGLAAGAFSMAAGEYTSVASQAESARHEIDKERREILAHPEHETLELARMYEDKGLAPELALQVATELHRDVERAVAVHAREEFGVDEDSLASPWVAAGASFVSFALGAVVPLLPYFLGATSLLPGVALTLLALFVCGAVVTSVTSKPWWFGGGRQLVLGAAATALTYGVGTVVGAGIG